MSRLALFLLAWVFAAPAMAAPAGDVSVEGKGKRVCRPAAATIGSHIKRSKICRTAAEWAELDASRRAADIPVKTAQPEPWERTRPQ
jgi:hypothetical protein